MVYCLAAAIYLLTGLPGIGLARQSGTPKGPPPGGPDIKAGARQREVRETMLRNAELGPAAVKRNEKRIEEAVEQVKQDFRQIQIVRNDLVRTLLADKPLDYKLVSDKAGEINKRAERLKTNLMPIVPEEKEKSTKGQIELNHDEMKGALVELCNQIAFFIDNPVLKAPGTVDVQQSAKAGGDLLSIIELSGNIKRSAERLKKTRE
jgi:hypothetical protein